MDTIRRSVIVGASSGRGEDMPYRHAWLFIVALIAATAFAFWRSYFSVLSTSSAGFHIHGVTAALWMLLLLAQSWTPHRGQLAAHRLVGRATFVAAPLFAAGAMAVMHSMAAGTIGGNPFYALWGVKLAVLDALAFGAALYAIGMALRHRRNVRQHAGWMLSTALPLVSPVLGRVFNQTVPGLIVRGPQDFPVFGGGVQLANLVAGLIALWLWRRDPRHGQPWAVALAVIVVQILAFQIIPAGEPWTSAYGAMAAPPLGVLLALGLAMGAATVWAGWTTPAGRRKALPAAA
jgi:hypothetical protein